MVERDENGQIPNQLSFEDWIVFIFDHPILDLQWWWQDWPSEHFWFWDDEADRSLTLSHLTRLFGNPSFLMDRFTRAQIDQGLNYIVSNSCSNHMYVLTDEGLPLQDRIACFQAMSSLYKNLFAPVYGNDISHLARREDPEGEPTFSCHMWWDVMPFHAKVGLKVGQDEMNTAALEVMRYALNLSSEACQESGIHGLGDWVVFVPELVEPILVEYIVREDINSALRAYAMDALSHSTFEGPFSSSNLSAPD